MRSGGGGSGSAGGLGLDVDGMRDPLEDQLLEGLEELAQKTDVLAHWADEMYDYVKGIPKSESHSFNFFHNPQS